MKPEYYTYVHRRNDTNEVFYVGKGKGKRAWLLTGRNQHWRRIVSKCGYSVEIVADGLVEADAYRQEKRLIKLYAREFLSNLTDGGEGISGRTMTPEHKEKISRALRGRPKGPMPIETREKLRAANSGKRVPPERVARQAAAQRGMKRGPMSEEQKEKLRTAKRGQRKGIPRGPMSEETKAKLRAINLGKKQSPETIAKRTAGQLGSKASEATREKLRIAQAKRWGKL